MPGPDPTKDVSLCGHCWHPRYQHVHEPPGSTMRAIDGMCSIEGCECSQWDPPIVVFTPPWLIKMAMSFNRWLANLLGGNDV